METAEDASWSSDRHLAMTPLWLLAVCSLQFAAPDWTYETSGIHLGLRQSSFNQQHVADGWQIQSQAVSSPWATDFLYSFPRPILRSEKPFIQCQIFLPAIPTVANANGRFQYLGLRVTELCGNQMVWPGCFIGRDASNGFVTLHFRALSDDLQTGVVVNENDWLTIGLAWTETGALQAMARQGRVDLGEMDLIAQDDGTIWNGTAWETSPLYIKHMTQVNGLFVDIVYTPDLPIEQQPIFTLAKIETRAQIVPRVTLSMEVDSMPISTSEGTLLPGSLGTGTSATDWNALPTELLALLEMSSVRGSLGQTLQGTVTLFVAGYPTEQYALQRSLDLSAWANVGSFADGDLFSEPISADAQFYRLTESVP